MKTTLDLPDELLHRAKLAALERGTSLKAIVVEALTRELGPSGRNAPPLVTHVYPPPERVGEMIDPDVVLQAVRALRDGDPVVPAVGDEKSPDAPSRQRDGPSGRSS